jgi:hypothetical protein
MPVRMAMRPRSGVIVAVRVIEIVGVGMRHGPAI